MAKAQKTSKKTLIIIIAAVMSVLILFDLSPFGGSTRFYSKWIECGQKPVELMAKPGLAWYSESASVSVFRPGYIDYACTPLQAEQAGYSANSQTYEFPHLTEDEVKARPNVE